MPRLLVVVVLPFLFKSVFVTFIALLLLSFSNSLLAQNDIAASGYLARINHDSPQEVADALKRAQKFYNDGRLSKEVNPIAIVLHGPEVEVFFKDNYEEYKNIVDLAQQLSEQGVVDVRVCETQTGIMGRNRSSIHPFIGTVNFGPTEVDRLLRQQNYVYF